MAKTDELSKKYNHDEVENGRYDWWVENGYFKANPKSNKPKFSIVLPPPNVTGKLHLGHAWDGSLQDALIRFKKLSGYETIYLPGMDHAGISMQSKVEERLRNNGINRFDLGREGFLEWAWDWKKEYAETIRQQWKTIGLSLDYSQEKFTLDEDINHLVNWVFVNMYNKGLIYKGKQIVNWDPQQKTAISNVEVIYKDTPGKMYYFKYRFKDNKDKYLEVATTRPETMFADQCIVVNPNDERYNKYIGKEVINPVNGETLPIIGDDYVEIDFGTGVMKATPAHDINDFEIAKRHNLAMPICLNEDGTVNEMGGNEYEGLDRFAARDKIVENLKKADDLIKIEDIDHQVGYSERSDAIVEPYLSTQWFVKMQPLAKMILDLQASDDAIKFFPERFNEVLKKWMENIHDWTISRQLWWGHRIPVWYHNETDEMYVGVNPPKDTENWTQDPDVLDTWFSSGLWPMATLGWNPDAQEQNEYFQAFFPTSVLVTGYDIIFFWVARMIFQSLEAVDEKPFDDVLIHGLVRDSEGRKMSKSLGNGIDPMDVIHEYGADALRFFLTTNSTPGQDIKYSEEKVRNAWNFINKLWNASRFVLMNLGDDFKPMNIDEITNNANLSDANKWILSELTSLKEVIIPNIEKYEFGIVGRELYSFVWDKYCSWFIELSKVELNNGDSDTKQVLFYVLKEILILLHPFIPFVTEEIYGKLGLKKSILEETIDTTKHEFESDYINYVIEMITALRDFRASNDIKKDVHLDAKLSNLTSEQEQLINNHLALINDYLENFVNTKVDNNLDLTNKKITSIPVDTFFIEIDNATFFDFEKQLEELEAKRAELKQELDRSEKMLANENFVKRAAPEKVQQEKDKYQNYQEQFKNLELKINELKSEKN
ncbi:valine--tRNA ligase [Mesoplasma lactucae]|uniref:Valine--tRNA ligase n=1 Tax=Mesoplasma lactucae ATCC 49193 TaxID=81460 RepID=A0A291IRL4_9MOLU|nr:valine--tRNA ligase [Mesoplasma lactucae]ATG97378.1 valine--tRNA ligase [Mesoplasma lactucae ATCC 49193]ATZ20170.1 valyl-tRNA synthetase [Mesoplasma lactucae ATCC 49193]MCL8216919.1 Valine--tRNA ligase [Mesoplasma lactucae ATCC 49193]